MEKKGITIYNVHEHTNKYILKKIANLLKGMKMAQLDLDEKSMKKTSLLIPVAVIIGTLLAIIAYTYLQPTTALITIFSGSIIVALITYALLKKKSEQ